MYLYLGQNTVIRTREIVGIFDLEITSISHLTKHFLSSAQQAGQVREVSAEIPKSFVVCEYDGQTQVYLSQISPTTLKKRSRSFVRALPGISKIP